MQALANDAKMHIRCALVDTWRIPGRTRPCAKWSVTRPGLKRHTIIQAAKRQDFPGGVEAVHRRIELALRCKFRPAGYEPFDFRMAEAPSHLSPKMAGFWAAMPWSVVRSL